MRHYIRFSLLVIVLAFSSLVLAVSSEDAKTYAQPYAEGQNYGLVPYGDKPLLDQTSSYWVVYFFPTTASPKEYYFSYVKMVLVSETGVIVTDDSVLTRIFKTDYFFDLENNFLKSRKLDYGNLRSSVAATSFQLSDTRNVVSQVTSSLSKRQHELEASEKVADLSARLTTIGEKLEQLGLAVEQGLSDEGKFSETGEIASYEAAVSNYNATFDSLLAVVDELTDYRNASRDADLYASLSSEEGGALLPASNKLVDLFPTRDSLEGPKTPLSEFNQRLAATDSKVQDAVSNTLSRKTRLDAENAYRNAKSGGLVAGIIERSQSEKSRFVACGISGQVSLIKDRWEQVQLVMEKPGASLEVYDQVPSNVSEILAMQAQIAQKYNECFGGATPTPKPQDYSGPVQGLVAVLVILVAAVVYFQQKKKQEESEFSEE